jgi:iron-sulfur cluster repair protein YtfE (RIC family)
MKRHPALAHLSRDHHPALILAQLLKRNAPAYKGLPTDIEGKVQYAVQFYEGELLKHFEEEEKMMDILTGIEPAMDEMIREIREEHIQLRKLFGGLTNNADTAAALDELGTSLDNHIRKEERQFFPLVEKNCDDETMAAIEKLLTP